MEPISDEHREALLESVPCLYCGGWHSAECLRVRQVTFDPSGKILTAKFWRTWDKSTTIFRHDLEDEEERVSLRGRMREAMKTKLKALSERVKDVFWTSSYLSWAMRAVTFVATLAVTALLVLAMVALVVHATGWLSFK